jgi:hypothetical protein
MKRTGRKKEWTLLVFCLFLLGISPPILLVFDKPLLVFGLPLSFLYFYSFWAVMIVFMAIGAHRRTSDMRENDKVSGQSQTPVEDAKQRGKHAR